MMNKMLGLMYRNVAIANHPKIMVPEGSANIHSMANGPLVVEYTWPMKPEIMTFQGNASDVFQVSDKIMQQATQLSGTFDSSRGGVVPNARAGSILNFYEEQEEQRESMQIKKLSAFIKKVGTMALGTAADFYKVDDGRTLRVVGERNYYKMRELKDTKKLSGPYDVRVERTTALSESKQGRIDQIVALGQVPVSTSPMDQAKPGNALFIQPKGRVHASDCHSASSLAVSRGGFSSRMPGPRARRAVRHAPRRGTQLYYNTR
jgi:hypothetical protein